MMKAILLSLLLVSSAAAADLNLAAQNHLTQCRTQCLKSHPHKSWRKACEDDCYERDVGLQAIYSASSSVSTTGAEDTADDTTEDGPNWDDVKNKTKDAADKTSEWGKNAADKTADGSKKAWDKTKDWGKRTINPNSGTAITPTLLTGAFFGILFVQLVLC